MKPYYQHEGITVYHGDFREFASSIAPADAIIADPPYGETRLDWDRWPEGWVQACEGLAPALWCFGSLRMFLDRRDDFKGWTLAQDLVWEKHNGSSLHADRFRRVHEHAVQFYQGRWDELYKLPVSEPSERGHSRLRRNRKPAHFGQVDPGGVYEYGGKRLMRSVISMASCHGYAVNETQKPEGIVDPLLRYSVPPGGSIIVPFAGSGTDLFVARSHGLSAAGCEIRESQCEEISKRLQQHLNLITNA